MIARRRVCGGRLTDRVVKTGCVVTVSRPTSAAGPDRNWTRSRNSSPRRCRIRINSRNHCQPVNRYVYGRPVGRPLYFAAVVSIFRAALWNRAGHNYGRPMYKGRPLYFCPVVSSSYSFFFLMVALCNRAEHYIFSLWFLSFFFFFPRLISAVGDWMSTILPHMG